MQRPDPAGIGLPATLSVSAAPPSNTFERMVKDYEANLPSHGGRLNQAEHPPRRFAVTRPSRFLPYLKELAEQKAAKERLRAEEERMEKEEEQREEAELDRQIERNRRYMMFAAVREKNLKEKHAALFYAYLVREAERERAERAEAACSSSDTDEFPLLLSSPSRAGPSTEGNTTPASSAPELEYRHGVPTGIITSPSLVVGEPNPAPDSSGFPQSSSHTSTPGGGPPLFRRRSYASVLSGTATSASSRTKKAATWLGL